MKWIVSRFLSDDLSEEPLLQIAGEGAVAINDCITKMFASNVFLEPRESETIGELALRFTESTPFHDHAETSRESQDCTPAAAGLSGWGSHVEPHLPICADG